MSDALGFASNADLSNGVVFGLNMSTWLLYTLVFLGLSFLGFAWVWSSDLIKDMKEGKSIEKPWD